MTDEKSMLLVVAITVSFLVLVVITSISIIAPRFMGSRFRRAWAETVEMMRSESGNRDEGKTSEIDIPDFEYIDREHAVSTIASVIYRQKILPYSPEMSKLFSDISLEVHRLTGGTKSSDS